MPKLHQIKRIRIQREETPFNKALVLESVPCACPIGREHMESYEDYMKRGKKAGYTGGTKKK